MASLTTHRRHRDTAVALALDVVSVVVFVAIGRRSHDEGSPIAGTAKVAAPFLVALATAWVATRAWRRPASCRQVGIVVWTVTVVAGLVLRRTVFDRGTAPSFVIVSALVLGVFLLGWRAVARRLRWGS